MRWAGPVATVFFLVAVAAGQAQTASIPPAWKPPAKIPEKYDVTKIGHRGIGGGLDLYSMQKEAAMGQQMAQEVDAESRFIEDPLVTEYVNRLAQNLVRNSDAKFPFTVKVIDSDEVNAFALPGGYFYVDSGLILAADNEAELAGVMAHEIAHVAARHATKQATRAQIFNLASIGLIFVGGPAGLAAREAMGLAVPMTFLKFSRSEETEADLLGIEYEYAAGYDPQAMVQFFERLKKEEKQNKNFLAKAFSTHPMTGDRVKRAQKDIAELLPPKDEYIETTSEFDEVKARLARMEDLNGEWRMGGKPVLRRRGSDGDGGNGPVLRRKSSF